MTIDEILGKAQCVTDDQGKRLVMLDVESWNELVELIEELEDSFHLLKSKGEETIPWEQAVEELRAQGIDV